MFTRVILVCLLVLAVSANVRPGRLSAHAEETQFIAWMAKYNKQYVTTQEYELRFQNFKASIQRIAEMNSKGFNATYALNKFSDMTPTEFRSIYLMKNPLSPVTSTNLLLKPVTSDVPTQYDWRTKNVVTPVKDQGQCGSCWAFSATENIESVWMLAKGLQVSGFKPLAPQQIVDCDTSDAGCNGGYPATAYQYVEKAGGLDTEATYPYRAKDGTCAFKPENVESKISNFKYATTRFDETTLKANLVSASPLSICIDAANWQDYSSGVMSAFECCWFCELDHCVQLIGYDTTASTPYYNVRNSWGLDWGENGYIRLAMGSNACGITDYATTSIAQV